MEGLTLGEIALIAAVAVTLAACFTGIWQSCEG
jgi:hypothetical protein